ncbi:MAG: ThiF family adenylyltransferase [Candidatus Thorarchaeota archaeon]|jgi:hypothetical protein
MKPKLTMIGGDTVYPHPEILGSNSIKDITNVAADDVRLELDVSRAGVTGSYGIKNALPNDINVFIVGCGGNGGYTVPQVARYIRAFMDKQEMASVVARNRKKFNIELTLIDGDTIELKNLIRQNFIAPDIGKNKARVMAERYGRAFGIEVGIVEKYLNAELTDQLIRQCKGSVVILGCVDNNATRKIIQEEVFDKIIGSMMHMKHLFWIDVANEMFDGQLVIGYRHSTHVAKLGYGRDARIAMYDRGWWDNKLNWVTERGNRLGLIRRGLDFPMPTFIDLFPEIRDEKPDFDPDDPSCADHAAEVEQAMATNIMSSSQLFSAFCQAMACLTDYREHGEAGNDVERRPRAYAMNFGHGGRASTQFNTIRNLSNIFVEESKEDDDER